MVDWGLIVMTILRNSPTTDILGLGAMLSDRNEFEKKDLLDINLHKDENLQVFNKKYDVLGILGT